MPGVHEASPARNGRGYESNILFNTAQKATLKKEFDLQIYSFLAILSIQPTLL